MTDALTPLRDEPRIVDAVDIDHGSIREHHDDNGPIRHCGIHALREAHPAVWAALNALHRSELEAGLFAGSWTRTIFRDMRNYGEREPGRNGAISG